MDGGAFTGVDVIVTALLYEGAGDLEGGIPVAVVPLGKTVDIHMRGLTAPRTAPAAALSAIPNSVAVSST
jgi:hypothetical protein